MKLVVKCAFVAIALFGMIGFAHAQAPKTPFPAPLPAPSSDASAANNPGWVARCTSTNRAAPLECAMEQSAVMTKTGQLVVLVNIHVPGDTRAPAALIQLPLGLNLPSGARLQIDENKPIDVAIQTCEARGCYINAPISADALAQLQAGKQLTISFQNLAKETISIPMPLTNFAAVYDKIK